MALHLRASDRDRVLAHWATWTDADLAQSGARWLLLFERRSDLASWIYRAWLIEERSAARDWAIAAIVRAIEGPGSIREDLPPRIALFPPALYAFEPGLSLRRGVRDLVQLAGSRVPIVVAPEAPPSAEEATAADAAPLQESSRAGMRADQWLDQAAQSCQLEIFSYPHLLWVAPWTASGRPSAADVAESLARAVEGKLVLERERAYEALAALGVSGWHAWCEERALEAEFDPALEAALFAAGPSGLEGELTTAALALYLVRDETSPAGRAPSTLGSDRDRLRFRALLRRLPSNSGPNRLANLIAGLPPQALASDLLHMALAWRDPAGEVTFLKSLLERAEADPTAFAWRLLLRAAQRPEARHLLRAMAAAPDDDRLRALYLQDLERDGLPLASALVLEEGERCRNIAALEDLALEVELRSNQTTAVDRALDVLLNRYQMERYFGSALARLQESFARCDPERRIHEGPRAPLFAALSKIATRDPARRNAAAALAHEMGWILVTDQLLRSSGVDPVPAPRLRDADPYEGGLPTSSFK